MRAFSRKKAHDLAAKCPITTSNNCSDAVAALVSSDIAERPLYWPTSASS